MARIVAAGVIDSGIATLTNDCRDPRATTAASWAGGFGTGGAGSESAITGAGDGPILPDGSQATTYMRYTITTANTGSNPRFGYNISDNLTTSYPSGTSVAIGIYARSSVPVADARARMDLGLDGVGGAGIAAGSGEALVAGVWKRIANVIVSTQTADVFRPFLHLQNHIMAVGQTYDVTCALSIPGVSTVPDHFDGDTDDAHWLGVPNASASALDYVIEPLLILDYGYQNQSRNVILDLLGSEYPAVFLRPAASKSGTLSMLFGSNETARAAQQILMLATRYSFEEEAAGEGFDFVRAGAVTVQKVVGIDYWITNVEFREVAAL